MQIGSEKHIISKEIFIKRFGMLFVIASASVLVGVIAVFYNEIFLWGTELARERFKQNPASVFFVVPILFLVSAFLCKKIAPKAAGSGPEHVISALEKLSVNPNADVKEYLSFRVLITKIVSSVLCVAGGGALGREGPVVQISASIFLIMANRIRNIWPSFDLRIWIVIGSAAGVAAAFNTPLAGIVFAIEELSHFHFQKQLLDFKVKAFFAVIVAGVTSQMMTGSYVLFEFPPMHVLWRWDIILVLIGISVVCGITGWILKKMISLGSGWRNSMTGIKWYIVPLVMGLIVATVSFYIGVNTFGAGMFTIKDAIHSSEAVITYQDSIGRFVNTIATAVSGSAGGLLLPALAIGAGVGTLGSMFLPVLDARIFIATGMAGLLAAMLNAPLASAVLVLEVTNQRELVFPLFLSTLIAYWAFQTCNEACELVKKGN